MKIVTITNMTTGAKVVRGPGWPYEAQDAGSKYGIIMGRVPGENRFVRVSWIDENENVVNAAHYRLAENQEDEAHAHLMFFEEQLSASEKHIQEFGELTPNLTEDSIENWNNAIELCIDIATETFKSTDELNLFLNQLYELKKDPEPSVEILESSVEVEEKPKNKHTYRTIKFV